MSTFLLHTLDLKRSQEISVAHMPLSQVDSCYSTEPDQVSWVARLDPVGARQAIAVPPLAWRHVPGPGLSSPPLLPSGLP